MRRGKLLNGLGDLNNLKALEIGPLDRPILSKDEVDVTYVDYTDTETLKQNYASAPDHDVAKIVNVDAVWGERTLPDALGEGVLADLVVASHVIEHVPDVITWFQEIGSALKSHGTVRLAIPDRRYCFDVRRRDSTVAELIYSYILRARKPLPHQILDFSLNFFAVDVAEAWGGVANIQEVVSESEVNHAIAVAKCVMDSGEYLDIHCWVFTPLSFSRVMWQLSIAGLINFSCSCWFDTEINELEFFVVMQKCDNKEVNGASWKAMHDKIAAMT